jgi:hypothetical protein
VSYTTISTLNPSAGTDYYEPWIAVAPLVIDRMAAEVTTNVASQNFRIGFYAATQDFQPTGPPLADSGDISTGTTGVKTYDPATPIFCPPGLYLSVLNTDTNSASFRTATRGAPMFTGALAVTGLGGSMGVQRMYVPRTYAAFPNPGSAWTTIGGVGTAGTDYMVFYRLSAA